MIYMKLNNIKIKDSFASTIPKEKKFLECRRYLEKNHAQDRYIVVDHKNILVDGYIQYLVLKEAGIEIVEVKISDKKRKKWCRKNRLPKQSKPKKLTYRESNTTYIFGVLINSRSKKERVWRIPNSWDEDRINKLNIGDIVIVHNRKRTSLIKITRIEKLNVCPIDIPVKKVIQKYY